MAINRQSLTEGSTATGGAGSASITTSVTVAAGDDRLMLVCIGEEAEAVGTPQVGSVAFGGVALTQLAEAGTTWSHAEIWYLKNPAVSTANVVTTWTPAGDDFGKHAIYVFDGVDQVTTFRTPQTTSGSAATSTLTVPSVAISDYLVDVLAVDSTGHNLVAGANQTEEYDTSVTGVEVGSSTQSGGDGGAMSWTWTTAADFSHVATGLIASTGTPDVDVDYSDFPKHKLRSEAAA